MSKDGKVKWRQVLAPATILCASPNANTVLNELQASYYADDIEPIEVKCTRCGLEWKPSQQSHWTASVCSNCYSDRVVVTVVRLQFEDWGNQNGGGMERDERWQAAARLCASTMDRLERLKAIWKAEAR